VFDDAWAVLQEKYGERGVPTEWTDITPDVMSPAFRLHFRALKSPSGRCLFGFGESESDNRAHDALTQALKNPLMDRGRMLAEASHVLVQVSGGPAMTLTEVEILMQELNKHIRDETQIIFGTTVDLARKLQGIGVAAGAYSSSPQCQQALKTAGIDDLFGVCIDGIAGERGTAEKPDPAVLLEAASRLGTRPQRCAVVESSCAGVAAGRDGGFGLVIGIEGTAGGGELARSGADVVIADLADIVVRTGDRRISELPNALASYGQLIGITKSNSAPTIAAIDSGKSAL